MPTLEHRPTKRINVITPIYQPESLFKAKRRPTRNEARIIKKPSVDSPETLAMREKIFTDLELNLTATQFALLRKIWVERQDWRKMRSPEEKGDYEELVKVLSSQDMTNIASDLRQHLGAKVQPKGIMFSNVFYPEQQEYRDQVEAEKERARQELQESRDRGMSARQQKRDKIERNKVRSVERQAYLAISVDDQKRVGDRQELVETLHELLPQNEFDLFMSIWVKRQRTHVLMTLADYKPELLEQTKKSLDGLMSYLSAPEQADLRHKLELQLGINVTREKHMNHTQPPFPEQIAYRNEQKGLSAEPMPPKKKPEVKKPRKPKDSAPKALTPKQLQQIRREQLQKISEMKHMLRPGNIEQVANMAEQLRDQGLPVSVVTIARSLEREGLSVSRSDIRHFVETINNG